MHLLAHLKNLTKHSFIYTISTLIQRAQGLVLLPILTDTTYITTTSEYGDYALVYTFIAFMNVLQDLNSRVETMEGMNQGLNLKTPLEYIHDTYLDKSS